MNIVTKHSLFSRGWPMATRIERSTKRGDSSRPGPDGPRGGWLTGCSREMLSDPLGFNLRTWRRYGDVSRIRAFAGISVYLLTHPDAVEHVLVRNHRNYRKPDFFNGPVGELAGEGLVTSEGDTWRTHRKLIQPAFHRERLAGLGALMAGAAEEMARGWQQEPALPGRTFDIL